MNITESSLRRVVREMLLEAADTPPTNVMYDVNKSRPVGTKTSQDVFARLRAGATKMQREFTSYMTSNKVITEKNATTDQSMAMNSYLLWYAIATGRSDQAPWLNLAMGTTWPTAALSQFQKEQGFSLVDGRLGSQTATYILSGGSIRRAPPGMKLEDADKIARGILDAEKILAKMNIRMGSRQYSEHPPQQIFNPNAPTPVERGRGKAAPDPMAAAAAKLTAPTRMKGPSLSDRGQMGGSGGVETLDMPIVNRR